MNLDTSGLIEYIPNPGFCGNDSFLFRAYDQWGHYADPVAQTIQVDCVNHPPVVMNDTGTVMTGDSFLITPLANDTDQDSIHSAQNLTINNYTNPSNGSVSMSGSQFLYTPNNGFTGIDVFSYTLIDQAGAISNTGTVSITVTAPNTPPNLSASGYNLSEDTLFSGMVTATDIDGNTLSYTATTLPLNGVLSLQANGNFTYTPNANFFGSDSFDVSVSDGTVSV